MSEPRKKGYKKRPIRKHPVLTEREKDEMFGTKEVEIAETTETLNHPEKLANDECVEIAETTETSNQSEKNDVAECDENNPPYATKKGPVEPTGRKKSPEGKGEGRKKYGGKTPRGVTETVNTETLYHPETLVIDDSSMNSPPCAKKRGSVEHQARKKSAEGERGV